MVNQCVCYRMSFEQLLAMAKQSGAGLVELHQATGCGGRCGLCIPYIRFMLKHEQTCIPVMWSQDFHMHGIRCTTIERLERRLREENHGEIPPASCAHPPSGSQSCAQSGAVEPRSAAQEFPSATGSPTQP